MEPHLLKVSFRSFPYSNLVMLCYENAQEYLEHFAAQSKNHAPASGTDPAASDGTKLERTTRNKRMNMYLYTNVDVHFKPT